MTYEEDRAEFLANVQAGDLVSWTTFDGSSVQEVYEVTDYEIVLARPDGNPGVRWPRSGTIHRSHYGGFDEKIGPAGGTQVEYFLRRRRRDRINVAIKKMDAESLEKVAEYAELVVASRVPPLSPAQLRQIADLLDAGERAFMALENITGRPAPMSGGSGVQDTLREMADGTPTQGTDRPSEGNTP
jgi:hypothetical protein